MMLHTLERGLWIAAVVVAAAGALAGWRAATTPPLPPPIAWAAPQLVLSLAPAETLSAAAAAAAAGDPFRLDRQPASAAYHPELEGIPPVPPPPAPPKPPLAVAGIVGGPPWAALLDGVPGKEGSVLVRAGDTLAALTVRAVTPTTVTITGLDTTWRLSLKRPWR
jgi:hypothetical protein